MTRHEAMVYWLMKYNKAKAHKDEHCDAEERHEHEEYVEACEQAFEALDVVSNEKYVELRAGMKKFRSGNFVIYDIDYLLKNLAREIFMLYQAVSDFNKPVCNLNKIRRMFVDYAPSEECTNPDTYGEICVKCGACGRKFDDKGVLIDNE